MEVALTTEGAVLFNDPCSDKKCLIKEKPHKTICHCLDIVCMTSIELCRQCINCVCRNEQFQEELWSISCDLLKDWMSPEIRSKYSTPSQPSATQSSDGGDVSGKTATTVDDKEKPPAAIGYDENTLVNDKSTENDTSR